MDPPADPDQNSEGSAPVTPLWIRLWLDNSSQEQFFDNGGIDSRRKRDQIAMA